MSAIEMATREHALVTTRHAPAHIAPSWGAIRALSRSQGTFTVPDVLKQARLAGGLHLNVAEWLRRLVKAGYLERLHRGRFRLVREDGDAPRLTQAGLPYAVEGQFTLVIPRNEDGVWTAIRELGRTGGEFSIEDIGARTHGAVPRAFVADYLRRLSRGGFIRATGSARAPRWVLTRAPAETPRLAPDGAPLRHAYHQDVVWKALEMSATAFISVEELIAAVSGEGLSLKAADVRDYIEHLVLSGHVLKSPHRAHGACYRLHRYTGPMAPRVIAAHFVWDPNKNCVFGEGQRVREVRR